MFFFFPVIFSDGPRPNQKEIISLRAFLLLFVKQLIMKVTIDVNCSFHLISGCAAKCCHLETLSQVTVSCTDDLSAFQGELSNFLLV